MGFGSCTVSIFSCPASATLAGQAPLFFMTFWGSNPNLRAINSISKLPNLIEIYYSHWPNLNQVLINLEIQSVWWTIVQVEETLLLRRQVSSFLFLWPTGSDRQSESLLDWFTSRNSNFVVAIMTNNMVQIVRLLLSDKVSASFRKDARRFFFFLQFSST